MDKEKIIKTGDGENGVLRKVKKTTDLENLHQKEEHHLYFCNCGTQINPDTVEQCSKCESIICERCKVVIDGRTLCRNCTDEEYHNLDENDFKILLTIKTGIYKPSKIAQILQIEKQEVEDRLTRMKNPILAKKTILGLFKTTHLNPQGEKTVEAYSQVYKDQEIKELKEKLQIKEVLR